MTIKNKALPINYINLDIIRLLSIMFVAFFHYTVQYPKFSNQSPLLNIEGFSGTIDLFFIMTGFLICLSVERNIGIKFLKNRFKKLYPTFVICCSISFVVLYNLPQITSDAHVIVYLKNISLIPFFTSSEYIDGAYWTLSYTIGFYMFMAYIYPFMFSKEPELCVAYLIMAVYLFKFAFSYIPAPLHLILLVNKNSGIFAYGMLVFLWYRQGFSWRFLLYYACILHSYYLHNDLISLYKFTAITFIFPILIFMTLPKSKIITACASLAKYTYAFYLLHQMIGFGVIYFLQKNHFNSIAILCITYASIFLLSISIFHIEKNLVTKYVFK